MNGSPILNGAIWLIGSLISADLSIGAQLWCDLGTRSPPLHDSWCCWSLGSDRKYQYDRQGNNDARHRNHREEKQ